MELTLEELKDRLARYEEVHLLELLQVTSEQLVEKFEDYIEEHYDELMGELEQDEEKPEDTIELDLSDW